MWGFNRGLLGARLIIHAQMAPPHSQQSVGAALQMILSDRVLCNIMIRGPWQADFSLGCVSGCTGELGGSSCLTQNACLRASSVSDGRGSGFGLRVQSSFRVGCKSPRSATVETRYEPKLNLVMLVQYMGPALRVWTLEECICVHQWPSEVDLHEDH